MSKTVRGLDSIIHSSVASLHANNPYSMRHDSIQPNSRNDLITTHASPACFSSRKTIQTDRLQTMFMTPPSRILKREQSKSIIYKKYPLYLDGAGPLPRERRFGV
ncbi:hypothetical protein BDZ45DRAFT_668391 [Acephala macrosclerotiorum]|nr:hypothetical protein BDZ45DRAFT_668391 [Acephala macrosclerotiorum]